MQRHLGALCDHLDVRVSDLETARTFYDPFCAALGLTHVNAASQWVVYESPNPAVPFLAITAEQRIGPSCTRIAFRASSRDDVDRIARVAEASGAARFEGPHLCPEYAENYYASFFEDRDGNRYEICHRVADAKVARIWQGFLGAREAIRGFAREPRDRARYYPRDEDYRP